MLHRDLGSSLCGGLGSEGSALAGTTEVQTAGAGPRNGVALSIRNGNNRVVKGTLDVGSAALDVIALTIFGADSAFLAAALVAISVPPYGYFFLLATVRFGPLRVRALVLVRCPLTGRPFLWRTPL